MAAGWFAQQFDNVLCCYSIALLLLAVTCLCLSRRHELPRLPWRWLASFALLQSIVPWLMLLATQADHLPVLPLRAALLLASLMFLIEFGRRSLAKQDRDSRGVWLHGLLLAIAGFGAMAGPNVIRIACGSLAGLLAASLTVAPLLREATHVRCAQRWPLRLAAAALFAYILAACFNAMDDAPLQGRFHGAETFSALTGVSPPLVLTLCAVVTALGLWLAHPPSFDHAPGTGKFGRWLLPAVVSITLAAGFWTINRCTTTTDVMLRSRLLSQTSAIARVVDMDGLRTLSFAAKDQTNPYFLRLRGQMMAYSETVLQEFGPKTEYVNIYSIAKRDGRLLFGPESIDDTSPRASAPGTAYMRPPAELEQVFQSGIPQTAGPYTDEYGAFVSGLAPVLDPVTGKVLLVIGIDVERNTWQAAVAHQQLPPILFTIAIIAIAWGGSRLLERRQRLALEQQWAMRYLEAFLTAAFGLVITCVFVWAAYSSDLQSRQTVFSQLAEAHAGSVVEALRNVLENQLASLARFFESSEEVTRSEFRAYAGPLTRNGVVQAWEWIPAVPASSRQRFEQDARRIGIADYAIHGRAANGTRISPAARNTYYPVLYVEPLKGNECLLGLDVASEPVRNAAFEEAARTGLPTATEPVSLIQDPAGQQGTLVVHPVYGSRTPSGNTPASRLRGFALVSLRLEALLSRVLAQAGRSEPFVCVDMYQLQVGQQPQFLASSLPPQSNAHREGDNLRNADAGHLCTVLPLFVFGKSYALVVHPGPAFSAAHGAEASWPAGLAGIFLTAVLTAFVGMLNNRRTNLEKQVQARTGELEERSWQLATANEKLTEYASALEGANQDLQELNRQARSATRAKSEFLANMSHEIRTPMTAILGYADILATSVETPEQRDAVEVIKRNGDHLLTLINDILDISKIEADKLHVEQVACSPVAILNDVVSLLRVRAEEKGLPLLLEYVGPIPRTVHTDPTRLRQILLNLVSNAVKFTDTGQVRITMRILDRNTPDPKLLYEVTDTGIGLSSDQIRRLFSSFQQADASTTRRFGGTGLGLAISKRLAAALGGDITVTSKLHQGSTFHVTIATGPLDGADWIDAPAEAVTQFPPQATPDTRPALHLACRILLVEDGLDNQRLISLILRKAGAEVELAENGQKAVEMAVASHPGLGRRRGDRHQPFDLILMDMQMPVMDGYEATRRLRALGYSLPIIALTAHAMKEDFQNCVEAGCNAYLTKPVEREVFLATIAQYTAQRPIEIHQSASASGPFDRGNLP